MKAAKRLAKMVLQQLPDEGRLIKSTIRSLKLRKDIMLGDLARRSMGASLPNPYEKHWIDPARIDLHTNRRTGSDDWEDWVFDQCTPELPVQDGDWDQGYHKVEELRIFQAIADRIRHGVSWQATDYYKYAISQIEGGRELWGCHDASDFDKHCANVDRLISSIATGGYCARDASGYSEVLVNIGRHGDCLFQDGRHRLAIARALGIARIPVQIYVRHAKWQSFRELMHRMARGNGGASKTGVLYQAPIHFDLSDIPAEHACDDRWDAVKPNLPISAGRALDIGCNLGFFCHRLEAVGYSCVGVEYLPDIAHAARTIARAENRQFKIVTGDILEPHIFDKIGGTGFEVVIALNIFHHFIKTREGYEKLRQFVGQIRATTMFFEPHLPDEPQMIGVFANPGPTEFVELIKQWGAFDEVEPIYSANDGRTVFRLSRCFAPA